MNKITGQTGFLITALLPHLINVNLEDCIIHFGGPSDISEFNEQSTNQMIQEVKELLRQDFKLFIFASSEGVRQRSKNYNQELYNTAKEKCENLIKQSGVNYIILRIPRVYGFERRKGLMKYIREKRIQDWDTQIEYYDIDEFVEETINFLLTKKINITKEYPNVQVNTIREIKEIYNL